jgi:hypothetical protein
MTIPDEEKMQEYLKTLTEDEKKVIQIAKKCLESSFDITKSIGYLKWKAKNHL